VPYITRNGQKHYYVPASLDKGWMRRAVVKHAHGRIFEEPGDLLYNVIGGIVTSDKLSASVSEKRQARAKNPIVDLFGAGFLFPASIAIDDIVSDESFHTSKDSYQSSLPRFGIRSNPFRNAEYEAKNLDEDKFNIAERNNSLITKIKDIMVLRNNIQAAVEVFFEKTLDNPKIFESDAEAKKALRDEETRLKAENKKLGYGDVSVQQLITQHADIPAETKMNQRIKFREIPKYLFGMWLISLSEQIAFDPQEGGLRNVGRGGCFKRDYTVKLFKDGEFTEIAIISFEPYKKMQIIDGDAAFVNDCITAWKHAKQENKFDYSDMFKKLSEKKADKQEKAAASKR
jgi:hypothetical protein